jgi:prepilin-type N-terminal cleavage/methylation domain-containing protein
MYRMEGGKMKGLNKKGFTLVELLAVIVVLAIIMVIATQAIGNVIKKNTVSSFKSSIDMVAKQAKQADTLASGNPTIDEIKQLVDYDDTQFGIGFKDANPNSDYICISTVSSGKFHNMDRTIFQTYDSILNKWNNKPGYANWYYDTGIGRTTACKKFR